MWIKFEQFVKDPVKAILFLALLSIGYLYIDGRNQMKDMNTHLQSEIDKKDKRIEKLETDIKDLYKKIEEVKK